MAKELTIKSLQHKIKLLKNDAIKHIRREEEANRKRQFVEYGHIKRTTSLINIIQELHREFSELKSDKKQNFEKHKE